MQLTGPNRLMLPFQQSVGYTKGRILYSVLLINLTTQEISYPTKGMTSGLATQQTQVQETCAHHTPITSCMRFHGQRSHAVCYPLSNFESDHLGTKAFSQLGVSDRTCPP